MKKVFLILLFTKISLLAVCQKFFEGVIEYKTAFQSNLNGVSDNELKERFGVKVMFYYKNGSYIRDYLDESGFSLRKLMYDASSNRVYETNLFNPDTVFYYAADKANIAHFEITNGPSDTVLSCICPSSIILYTYFEKLIQDSVSIRSEYYFCDRLPVNPDYYKNFYLWYDIIKDRKSIAIKFTEEPVGLFKIIYTAVKIDHTEVPDEMFELDKKLVLKQQTFD